MDEEGVTIINATSNSTGDVAFTAEGAQGTLVRLMGLSIYLLYRDGNFPNSDFRDFIDAVEAVATKAYDIDRKKVEGEV